MEINRGDLTMKEEINYEKLGVSSQKEDVHEAIKNVDKGLFPSAFCKVIPDILAFNEEKCLIVHADGAGTKSVIAYLSWKEYDDPSIFKGISQDALVMNVDDIACCGFLTNFSISNTIGRNKFLVNGSVIKSIIKGYQEFTNTMNDLGCSMILCGGETADVGDLVRTVIVDSTVIARGSKNEVIQTKNIIPGDVIVGLSSTGQASYESDYNSGISSNGITLARHVILDHSYMEKYPEICDPSVNKNIAYQGKYFLDNPLPNAPMTIGDGLLSPTRSYIPILLDIFSELCEEGKTQEKIHGIIHNTGGGQTKCLKFGSGLHYIKNNLFPIPPIFKLIQTAGKVEWQEMYKVFNMGHRLEIMCPKDIAKDIIEISNKFNVDAKIIGRVEASHDGVKNKLTITSEPGNYCY